MNHPPPNQTWPDVYEHCHRCEKIKQKLDMAKIDTHHYCVECVPVMFLELTRKLEALRNEVKAWRECRLWTDDNGNWKWYDTATTKLFEQTNALGALEDV